MNKVLNKIESEELSNFTNVIKQMDVKIGFFGSRKFTYRPYQDKGKVTVNELWKVVLEKAKQNPKCPQLKEIVDQLKNLDQRGYQKLQESSKLKKFLHKISHFFGGLFFNREKAKNQLEIIIKNQANLRRGYGYSSQILVLYPQNISGD